LSVLEYSSYIAMPKECPRAAKSLLSFSSLIPLNVTVAIAL
jgi:hypothetical protein